MRELKKTIKKTIKGRLSSQEEGLVTLERKQGNVCFSMCYQILTISSFNIFMVLFLPWTNQIWQYKNFRFVSIKMFKIMTRLNFVLMNCILWQRSLVSNLQQTFWWNLEENQYVQNNFCILNIFEQNTSNNVLKPPEKRIKIRLALFVGTVLYTMTRRLNIKCKFQWGVRFRRVLETSRWECDTDSYTAGWSWLFSVCCLPC